jgi:hypothetical protein
VDFHFTELGRSQELMVKRRTRKDWPQHLAWLAEAYPFDLRWNLPVDFSRFSPGLFQGLMNVLDGMYFQHRAFYARHALQGVITWQKTTAFAHNLWLAFPPEHEREFLPEALGRRLRGLARKHPLSIDYPAGRFSQGFQTLGFTPFRTLIWMRCDFKA